MKILKGLYTGAIFLFLYAPIAVMIVFSFNGSNSTSVMSGFSLKWYKELISDTAALQGMKNTLILAFCAAVVSTFLGTLAAAGILKVKSKILRNTFSTVTNIPMMSPEIVTGVSMMLLFVFSARLLHMKNALGFGTLLIAHITFCLPYVILSVLPKLRQMSAFLTEAAEDLGCSSVGAFFRVIMPNIFSGIFTGFIMAFTLSLDDFIISYFVTGAKFQTLPIVIFSMTKKKVRPDMYALSTIIFFVVLLLLIIMNTVTAKSDKKKTIGGKK